ncbi:MAG: hypothetical protein KGI08_08105 [Thaumarchaeota archaeon]|nr:hypothetical protein [Nitrososphaerota archaeon]
MVNDSDKDFVDKYDGDEYIVPAHGELAVPDYIAFHFCGNPDVAGDGQRAAERRGDGGKSAIGVSVYIKPEGSVSSDEEFIVDGGKPVATVKVSKAKKAKE